MCTYVRMSPHLARALSVTTLLQALNLGSVSIIRSGPKSHAISLVARVYKLPTVLNKRPRRRLYIVEVRCMMGAQHWEEQQTPTWPVWLGMADSDSSRRPVPQHKRCYCAPARPLRKSCKPIGNALGHCEARQSRQWLYNRPGSTPRALALNLQEGSGD